ncbi:PepSY-associated TM helix domain-containing protein [Methylocapsa palsarum]|uniref:Uncharacterized iron-regulated membrane protein n=1 Tax=Methylocapsa palsarum TaxID=1612308 RepID=A0A1I4BMI9_9HYPH|nr:PepSY-associated TM helix domain-containing protein [Methylocapsa palsarum]SFK69186.1 Uncharacterized iron-regulated membrane protein [Methylocapsa palsarum]
MPEHILEGRAAIRLAPRPSPRLALGRKLWIQFHSLIGLFLGAVFVVIGLTGSILAYWQTIDEGLNSAIMRVENPTQASYRPLDEIFAAAQAAAPESGRAERLRLPRHPGAAAAVTYIVPVDDLSSDYYEVFVDPYTAKATGRRLIAHGDNLLSQPFIRIVMDLHWTLLLGYDRGYVVGVVAIFIFLSSFAGLYLWWPRNSAWRQALTIKWNATPERVAFDVHKTTGLYLGGVLIVLLATGIVMIFKPQARAIVETFSPIREEPRNFKSTLIPGRAPIGLDSALVAANAVFPDGRAHWILLPGNPGGVYVVGKQSESEPNRASTNRNVTIDQYSGAILHIQDRNTFTAGETFLEWQYPLHCGEAFGNAGRAVVMAAGFTPLILSLSGFFRWRQKRRARRR